MTVKHLYPNCAPALNLNFKSSGVADPRISCTRSTTGTYVDLATGLVETVAVNVARVGETGLIVEEARTNIQLNSAAPITSGGQALIWTTGVTAPDGTSTAVKIAATAVDTQHNITTTMFPSAMPLTDHAWSCFAKADGVNRFTLRNPENGFCTFDLRDDGTVINPNTEPATIEKLGNGWFRCTVTGTPGTVAYQYNITLNADDETGFTAFLGDGSGGIMFWGWQMEEGTFSTSYIPTSSSTVTRTVDLVKISGTDFSNFFKNSAGTFVARLPTKTPAEAFFADVGNNSVSGSVASGYILKYVASSNNASGDARVNDGSVAFIEVSVTGSHIDLAFAYEENNFNAAVNGTLGTTDTSGALPTLGAQQVVIGSRFNSQVPNNVPMSSLSYYSTRVANTELQALTQ